MTKFRLRGTEVSRVEALSDAVFALALTLLIVSVDVPSSYDAFIAVVKAFPIFAVCFASVIWIWHKHYVFFRRYGMQDGVTITANCALLFIVLFYVFPLKFLYTKFIGGVFNLSKEAANHLTAAEARELLIIYGIGYCGVFLTFAFFYWRAFRERAELGLSRFEIFDTKSEIYENLGLASVGLLSIAIAFAAPPTLLGISGWCYALIGVVKFIHGTVSGTMRSRLERTAA